MKKHLIVFKELFFLWQKLLDSGVDGRILNLIKDMSRKAKSCVKTGNVCSDYFHCYSGVRRGRGGGDFLPVLFAIYLNVR